MSKPTLRNKRFKVSLSEKELVALRKYAKKNNAYMAEVTREFILKGLKKVEKNNNKKINLCQQ